MKLVAAYQGWKRWLFKVLVFWFQKTSKGRFLGIYGFLEYLDIIFRINFALKPYVYYYRQDLPHAALPIFRLLTGRFGVFSPRRGDTLHRSRSNLAGRSGP